MLISLVSSYRPPKRTITYAIICARHGRVSKSEMNIKGTSPKRNLSVANDKHKKYPFIARYRPITRINWSTDITYIKTNLGTVYLVAIVDWHSRFIISWNMSNTMCKEFCIDALVRRLRKMCQKFLTRIRALNLLEILLSQSW